MFKKVVCILFLVFTSLVSAQKYVKHTVSVGETMTQIAKKYNVTPLAIYELNPDAKKGIQLNSVLLIPKNPLTVKTKTTTVTAKPSVKKEITPAIPKTTTTTVTTVKQIEKKATVPVTIPKASKHVVVTKETLYSISELYNITVEDLQKANVENLKEGLRIGDTIEIPAKQNIKVTETKSDKLIYHQVLAKETKYAIANKYGLTVEQLEKQNPGIESNMPIGYQLLISGPVSTIEAAKEKIVKPEVKPKVVEYVNYEVKPKETLYSLTRMCEMTPDEFITLNPELANGVKEGMILKIPSTVTIINNTPKEFANLTKSIKNQTRKELVLLLPFNISKIESDTINSTVERLKKDKFLNMTLDFYSGVLMAIDSAKTLGLNIDVKILDSQETKNSSNVINLVQQQKLENADVIIGPFYQTNVEKLAELLNSKNVPVISPLSKETVKYYSNLYQSMPSNDVVRNTMFEYLHSKEGNIIAVISPKKTAIKQYLSEQQKEVKLAELDPNGLLILENFKKLFVKDKMNYVVMDSQNTNMIFALTNAMLAMMTEYQVQLVILEPNATLDFEEIDLERLTKLKMLYPSLTRENETPQAEMFRNDYRLKNKILPNQYATRGFDVTFDTMMRLSQDKSFEETILSTATEQVENKFDYNKKTSDGYANNGIYILYYDADLTIKEAK